MKPAAQLLSVLGLAVCMFAGSAAVWRFLATDTPAANEATGAAPGLVIDTTEWNFGPVRQESEPLTHAFALENRGPAAIDLKRGVVGCGCMSIRCPEHLMPGSRAAVEVTINPRQKTGPFIGPAEIETTDPANPVIRFRVRADAVPPYSISPDAIEFLDVQPGDLPEREFSLDIRLDPGADLPPPPRPEPAPKAVSCDFLDREVSDGNPDRPRRVTHRYAVRLDARAWLAEGQVESATTAIHFPALTPATDVRLPIRVTRRHHSVVIGQTSVALYRSRPAVKAPVRFWARDGRALEIASVRPSSPAIAVEVAQRRARILEISATLAPTPSTDPADDSGHIDVQFADGSIEPYRVSFLILP
jgi:hypothetical protein